MMIICIFSIPSTLCMCVCAATDVVFISSVDHIFLNFFYSRIFSLSSFLVADLFFFIVFFFVCCYCWCCFLWLFMGRIQMLHIQATALKISISSDIFLQRLLLLTPIFLSRSNNIPHLFNVSSFFSYTQIRCVRFYSRTTTTTRLMRGVAVSKYSSSFFFFFVSVFMKYVNIRRSGQRIERIKKILN